MIRLLPAVLLVAALGSSARAACNVRKPEIVDQTQGYADSLGNGECFVDVTPSNIPDMIYRSYTFFDTGLLMVFNSYGGGTNSNSTSAREFYFFPRSGPVDVKMDSTTVNVSVTMADGDEIVIDPATAQIRSSSRGDVTVSPRIDRSERGGVEFPHYNGLMLDTGFKIGASPATAPDGEAVFRSAYGQLCKVTNREIFNYAGGEHTFKFDDEKLSAWLKKRCPALHAGF
jgi:hypothetical protein